MKNRNGRWCRYVRNALTLTQFEIIFHVGFLRGEENSIKDLGPPTHLGEIAKSQLTRNIRKISG